MLLSILAILSLLQQGYCCSLETTEQNKPTCSFMCNDDTLKKIGENFDYLVNGYKVVLLKLDAMNTNTNQQDIPSNCNDCNELDAITPLITNQQDIIKEVPINCNDALKQSGLQSGVHKIRIPNSEMEPFPVYCLADPNKKDASWTLIQRRMDGSVDFYRNWTEYQQGFGNLEGEFFLGLDKIHALTESTPQELWIQLEDFENASRSANYSSFGIGDASKKYILNNLGTYSGDAGDSMRYQAGQKFTTYDMDNGKNYKTNCAVTYKGAWWYYKCHHSNLNGVYMKGLYGNDKYGQGINWKAWHDVTYSLKYAHMAIRPVSTNKLSAVAAK